MSARNNAILKFYSSFGDVVRLSIPRADMTLTQARVTATMNDMIDLGIVATSSGTPATIRSAEIVTTNRTPLVNA